VRQRGEELVLGAVRGLGFQMKLRADADLFFETFGRAFPVRDVARDLRGTDDVAFLGADGGNRQRDVDEAAVLPAPHRLEVFEPLAPTDPIEDERLLAQPLGRNDECDRPADGLGGAESKQALRAGVPGRDDAVQILRDDRVIGRIDECREEDGCMGKIHCGRYFRPAMWGPNPHSLAIRKPARASAGDPRRPRKSSIRPRNRGEWNNRCSQRRFGYS